MTEMFTVALRGYDRFQVERVLGDVDEALASGSGTARSAGRETLLKYRFTVVLRGYAVDEVDRAVQERLDQLGGEAWPSPTQVSFTVVLRGYDMTEVDRLLSQAAEAWASSSDSLRASARAALTNAVFRQRLRGYSRDQVDREIQQRLRDLQPA